MNQINWSLKGFIIRQDKLWMKNLKKKTFYLGLRKSFNLIKIQKMKQMISQYRAKRKKKNKFQNQVIQ